ncbi:C40 family peptidase [Candidatus Microgenomates bacterium]|nr:C40 family peptidase [Candidatus Microgenomates bacterium]
MFVVKSWLDDLLKKPLSLKQLTDAMERAGMEVEGVQRTPALDPRIVVAKITSLKRHPNADKLKIIKVYDGQAETVLVTGAANLVKGQKVPLAPVGSTLPDGTKLTAREIRGVASPGMVLSARELSLGDDHAGIMILEKGLPLGAPLSEVFPEDAVIDIKTAANRPDLNGLIWIAREVAAYTNNVVRTATTPKLQPPTPTHFTLAAKDLVRRYGLAKLQLPAVLPASPQWLQQRLQLAGVRPINVVVDITNYILFEVGQPLHAFDAAKVNQKVAVRLARKGEKLVTLDGVTRTLAASDLVIADSRKAIGLAGVMGGANSEIDPTTREVLLESANFDGATVRQTAQRQGLRTEASARFERNLPVQFALLGLERGIELLVKHAGAKLIWVEDELTVWPWVQHVGVRPERLSQLAGFKISSRQVLKALHNLGFAAEPFDIALEAKKRLGKPYVWKASFKKNGDEAFDCSYLIDRIYSLIGQWVGHTSLAQLDVGQPVDVSDLKPGDVLFYQGHNGEGKRNFSLADIQKDEQPRSVIGYYFKPNGTSGYDKLESQYRGLVGHNGIYIGDGKVVDARRFDWQEGRWRELPASKQVVQVVPIETYTKNPEFLGARRYVDDIAGWAAVTVPYWRQDVKSEEDVFEEVIKQIGLDQVSSTLPTWQPPRQAIYNQRPEQLERLRAGLVGLGLYEVVTYPFVSGPQLVQLGLQIKNHLKLKNPRSVEQSYLRSSLLPSLLQAIANNSRLKEQFGLFEMAKVYLPQAGQPLPSEPRYLGVALYGQDYLAVKNILDNLLRLTGVTVIYDSAHPPAYAHPSRQAVLRIGREQLGTIGEINPKLARQFKMDRVAYLELDLDKLATHWQLPVYQPLPHYQVINRDITLLINRTVSWDQVRLALAPANLASVRYIGDYYDPDLGQERALTLRLEITPNQPVMTETEVNRKVQSVVTLLAKRFGAKSRDK